MLINGALIVSGLAIVVAALIERPPLAMRRWDEPLPELDDDMRPKEPWGSYVAVLAVFVVFVAIGITSALSYSRTAGDDFLQPIPDGVDPLVYSDDVTSWCGEQSTQGLADRFEVAPTAEAAARAVADEARNSRRDPYWFAAYESCLRGLSGR